MKTIVLFAMIFMHIVDDYYLQGILAKMKQKTWWQEQQGYSDKYKHDYIICLIMHSFSWAFMIMLPLAFCSQWELGWFYILYPINTIIHSIVDDLKANKKRLNLVQDQAIHITQILTTYTMYLLLA